MPPIRCIFVICIESFVLNLCFHQHCLARSLRYHVMTRQNVSHQLSSVMVYETALMAVMKLIVVGT